MHFAENVSRASTEKERIRKLAASGTITVASMWHHTGAVCINGPPGIRSDADCQ